MQQNFTFFGPDFAPTCSHEKYWVRYIQNYVPKHARGQKLAQIGVFRLYDTFKALKRAKNAPKGQKLQFRSTLRAKRRQKSFSNQLFLYESLFTYVLAVYTWIFVPKFKKSYFEVISGFLEKRISSWCAGAPRGGHLMLW